MGMMGTMGVMILIPPIIPVPLFVLAVIIERSSPSKKPKSSMT
jgi:hypothetical protein